LALKELNEVSKEDLVGFKEQIQDMLSDPDMKVKRAVITISKKL